MKRIPLMLAFVLLAGCAPEAPKPTVIVSEAKPRMPESIRKTCDPVPADIDGDDMGALLRGYTFLQGKYGECARRDMDKAGWVASQGM